MVASVFLRSHINSFRLIGWITSDKENIISIRMHVNDATHLPEGQYSIKELMFGYIAGLLTLINPCVLPVLPLILASEF